MVFNLGKTIPSQPVFLQAEEPTDIIKKLKAINSSFFLRPDSSLINKLNIIDPVDLTKLLERYFAEMIQGEHIDDPVQFLDRLATIIPFNKIQEAVKDNLPDALEEALSMFEEAKLYIQATEDKSSPGIRARITSVLEGIISVIESIIAAFGIAEFFNPSESELHASEKSKKIIMLATLFGLVSSLLLPVLGAASGGLILGGIIIAISALSLIYPYIKPMTTHLPGNAVNWTKDVQSGSFIAQGRKESLDSIASILTMNRHALLVGPSRVGKTLTAKSFTQSIERGDYPELKGKTVFYINTADILGHKASLLGGGSTILTKISKAMGRHRDDIILIFDVIHMACKNNEKIADQLTTFLDENGAFPHVIGITTNAEYEKYVKKNNAFSLRFDKVDIKNTKDETIKILSDILLKNPSKPLIQQGMLDHIYKSASKNKQAPQPSASIKLLKQCIHLTEQSQKSLTEVKITEVSNSILSRRSQAATSRGRNDSKALRELEKELKELQNTLIEEKKALNKLFRAKELLDKVTRETYSTVINISSIAQNKLNSKNEKQVKLFVLLHEFLGPALESYIETTAQTLGVKVIIDKSLINVAANT